MGRIWLMAPDGSRVVEQVARPLQEHFGAPRVLTRAAEGEWRQGDAVVALLEATGAAGDGAGAPWSGALDARVEQALAADAPLIPVLVDGVTMPAAAGLPPALRPLAYKHALPVRSDERLPRDVGRLVEDLEAQLRHVVGEAFPYDFWLLPVGGLLATGGVCYSATLVRDVTDWSFGYERADALERGMWALAWAGPGLLGAGLLIVALGWWWRTKRTCARRRAEFFRRGSGALPPPVNGPAWACYCAGAAAVGWGPGAASVASACAAPAVARRRHSGRGGRLIALGLAAAVAGSAWTTAVWLRQRELRAAVQEYAAGREEQKTEKLDAAIERFQRLAARWPWYANGHFRLAEALAEQDRDSEALAAADAAIRRYPTGGQGVWGPDQERAREAYLLRSKLHDRLGDGHQAARDSEAAGRVNGFFNIFGGLMRFWESVPTGPEP
jgi:tetratricopeptide (TPR) repeat protein